MKRIKLLIAALLLALVTKAQVPATLSPADKVYGLSKFWQEVNYNFIYLDKVDRIKWDSTYKAMITSVQQTQNDYLYYRELQKFCALLNDGHTNIYVPRSIQTYISMFGEYRLFIENIDSRAIITRTNLSKKEEIPIGTEILEVNGKPIRQYINENVKPYLSSSTDYVLEDMCMSRLLEGLEGDRYTLKIRKPNGELSTLSLTHKKTEEQEVFPAFKENIALMEVKWLPNQVVYVALNSFMDPEINKQFEAKLNELSKAKALIIDLRNNGGGSTDIGFNILQYLTSDSQLYGSRSRTRIHNSSFKAWGKFVTPDDTVQNSWNKEQFLAFNDRYYLDFDYKPASVKHSGKRIVVPTVLLTGHGTASAAEDFLIYADNQKHMTRIGANTFGSTGQPYMFDLPGGGSARICTKQDIYPDGREFVGYGIKPHIEIKPTLADYLKQNDPVLEKALQVLKAK